MLSKKTIAEKTISEAGANQRTPSVPQYFSWINNTNEESTEAQTHLSSGWCLRSHLAGKSSTVCQNAERLPEIHPI